MTKVGGRCERRWRWHRKFNHPLPLFQELSWCTSRGSVAAMLPELPPPTPFLPLNIPPPSHLVLPGPLCKCEPTRPSLLVDPPYTSPLFYPFGSPGSPPPPANCLQLAAPKSKSAGAVHSEQKMLCSVGSFLMADRKGASSYLPFSWQSFKIGGKKKVISPIFL